jgi:predicted nuclease of predicted toxin-antitoxin system
MIFQKIKILSDENVSPKVVKFFRNNRIDVLDVKEQGWFGKEDHELLNIAYQSKRFVLTHDSDFGTLAIHEGQEFYGIIYLRLKNCHPQNVIKMCNQLLELKVDLAPETLIVVEEFRLRIRQFNMN